jgi:hemerythrin-like domain-containing protein
MSGEIDLRRSFVEKTHGGKEEQEVCDMMKDDGTAGSNRPSEAGITHLRESQRYVRDGDSTLGYFRGLRPEPAFEAE